MPDAYVRAGEPPAIVAPIEIVTTSAAPFATMRHFISLVYRNWVFGFADGKSTHQLFVINLDKDALARTNFGSLHYGKVIALLHNCEASRTTGVIESHPTLGYVGNAVFELHKCVWTVVDTQSITCTKVLINPNSHDLNDRGNEQCEKPRISGDIRPTDRAS
jgi:hypothetical protein